MIAYRIEIVSQAGERVWWRLTGKEGGKAQEARGSLAIPGAGSLSRRALLRRIRAAGIVEHYRARIAAVLAEE